MCIRDSLASGRGAHRVDVARARRQVRQGGVDLGRRLNDVFRRATTTSSYSNANDIPFLILVFSRRPSRNHLNSGVGLPPLFDFFLDDFAAAYTGRAVEASRAGRFFLC